MKALLGTALVGLVVACSNQQPANSAAAVGTNEPPAASARTNAASESQVTASTMTAVPSTAAAPERTNSLATPGTAPDDTRVNERDVTPDQRADAPTPLDQGESASDRAATQQIRKAIMADDSLSFTAKNVKIITLNGKVTLRGPVNSAREHAAIDAAAKRATGVSSVDNQLEVKP